MKCSSLQKKTLPQQCLALKSQFPNAKVQFNRNKMTIKLLLQPTELSREYLCEFIVERSGRCTVWVSGDMKKLNAVDFPHKYKVDMKNKKVQVCLYHPSKDEWNPTHWLKDSLVPWTCEWLLFYELWLSTGEWLGGGEHPSAESVQV